MCLLSAGAQCPLQIDKIIYFETDSSSLNQWDKHIQIACDAVNAITDQVGAKYPEYV